MRVTITDVGATFSHGRYLVQQHVDKDGNSHSTGVHYHTLEQAEAKRDEILRENIAAVTNALEFLGAGPIPYDVGGGITFDDDCTEDFHFFNLQGFCVYCQKSGRKSA